MGGTLYWRVKRPDGKWTFMACSDQLRKRVQELGYGFQQIYVDEDGQLP
jgi:hypothetical protein